MFHNHFIALREIAQNLKGGIIPMKKIKKALALTFAALLVTALLPVNAFAADIAPDITSVTIKGVLVPDLDAGALHSTVAGARANTVELALSPAELNGNAAIVAVVGDGDTNAKTATITAGSTDNVEGAGEIGTAVTASGTAALVPGSYVWISDGEGANLKFARILINQKSGGTFEGGSTVKTPIYNVVVPGNVNFALNPLQLGTVTGASQITTANYKVINKSDVDVLVTFDITATLKSDVKFVEKSALDQTSTSGAPKDVYFAALSANGVTTNSLGYGNAATDDTAVFTYDANPAKGTLVPFGVTLEQPGNEKAKMAFLLGKSTASAGTLDTLALQNQGVASFQFYAELNTYAAFQPNDITVSGGWTLQGIKGADYKTQIAEPTDYVADSLNQVPLTPPTPPYGFLTGTGVGAIDLAPTGSDSAFEQTVAFTFAKGDVLSAKLPFAFDGKTITQVWTEGIDSSPWPAYDATASLTQASDGITFAATYKSAVKFNMFIDLDNGDHFKAVVTITD
jgi:hypothetical protein